MKGSLQAIGLVLSGCLFVSLTCLGGEVNYIGPAAPPDVQPLPVWDVPDLERLFLARPAPSVSPAVQDWARAMRPDSKGIVDLSMPIETGHTRENPWQTEDRPAPREIRFEVDGTVKGPVAIAYINGSCRKLDAIVEGWTFAAALGREVLLQRETTLIRVPAGVTVTVRF